MSSLFSIKFPELFIVSKDTEKSYYFGKYATLSLENPLTYVMDIYSFFFSKIEE